MAISMTCLAFVYQLFLQKNSIIDVLQGMKYLSFTDPFKKYSIIRDFI